MISLSSKAFELFDLQTHHAQKIAQLMQQYANLPMDLADASLSSLPKSLVTDVFYPLIIETLIPIVGKTTNRFRISFSVFEEGSVKICKVDQV